MLRPQVKSSAHGKSISQCEDTPTDTFSFEDESTDKDFIAALHQDYIRSTRGRLSLADSKKSMSLTVDKVPARTWQKTRNLISEPVDAVIMPGGIFAVNFTHPIAIFAVGMRGNRDESAILFQPPVGAWNRWIVRQLGLRLAPDLKKESNILAPFACFHSAKTVGSLIVTSWCVF